MPLNTNGQYESPTFVNDSAPALDATEMNAMAGAVQGAVEYDRSQSSLTNTQKQQAASNIGAVQYISQTLTEAQQIQALANLGAPSFNYPQTTTPQQKTQMANNAGAVSTAGSQTLSSTQKLTARTNIGAFSASGVTVTVASGSWNGSSAPYTNSVSVSGVTASNHILVSVGSSVTAAQYSAFADAQIVCTSQGDGSIVLSAFGDKPTIDLPVNVVILTQ